MTDRPIIVCGPARGGTSTVRAMLNLHPEIQLGREVPLGRLPSLRPLLREAAEYQGELWTAPRKAEVVRSLWFAASRPMPYPPARRWGMKTPWSEFDSELWDAVNPLYVYALRRGDRVFQSHIRLGWHDGPPRGLIDRYKRSLRTFEVLRARGAAHMVQLDRYDSAEGRRHVAEGVFDFVGEKADESILQTIADFTGRLNAPTSRPGEEPRLPADWRAELAGDDEYRQLMATFGY